jgi:UDP-N-acetylmuramate dehydrogenase
MNAGAFDGETWDRVQSVRTIDRAGAVRERARSDFEIAYRTVKGAAGEWFVDATFALEPGREAEAAQMRELLAARSAKQPLGRPSAGSVFRNPSGDFAGRLVEQAGLKGLSVGGAMVSEKHANFIINTGTATASDIEALIGEVREGVRRATGIELELEVRVLGERAGDAP